jgi:hypothetical protein
MRCSLLLTLVFLIGHLEASSARAAGKYDPYLRYFPESINAFVVCEIHALYQSDLAKRERWETAQPLPGLHPQITHGLLGAKFNPGAVGADVWEVILAFPRGNVDLAKIATQENGAVDIVSGLSSVLSPRNAYFVELGPSMLAVLRPANRQDLVNWIRFMRANQKPVLSLFLLECVAGRDKDPQILMALDLTDSVSPAELRKRLARSQTVQEKKPDLDALIKVLASIRGVKLTLHVNEQIAGELTVSFRENADPLMDIGQPLLLEILAFRGAMIDGLEQWQAETAGTRLTLRGPLSTSGLRQILSLIQLPPPVPSEGETPAKLTEEIHALASQRYFRAIQTLLDDLKKHDRKARNYGDTALWHGKGRPADGPAADAQCGRGLAPLCHRPNPATLGHGCFVTR